jgi:hypothetical protein
MMEPEDAWPALVLRRLVDAGITFKDHHATRLLEIIQDMREADRTRIAALEAALDRTISALEAEGEDGALAAELRAIRHDGRREASLR